MRRILSVDDELDILFTRQLVLEEAGYEVLSASNGRQALACFDALAVDLVVLDFRMPGMDGNIVAREMKQRRPSVPILMVSGDFVDMDCLARTDRFLAKGHSSEALLREVEQLLVPALRRR
ncbi:MAG: response regulator [Terracidiphilus sp.]